MSKFGWDLPPGCTQRHIDEAFGGGDEHCEVCMRHVDDCICPECPVCHETGNPVCYMNLSPHGAENHGLDLSKAQQASRAHARIAEFKERIQDEELFLASLESQDDE